MKNILHLALFACLITSVVACKKHHQTPNASINTVKSAQQIFKDHHGDFSKTKSTEWQDIACPLPANFTPIWEAAIESYSESATFVTVPINTPTKYTAVFPCTESNKNNHSHERVTVVQKLVIAISNESSECYIVNIIPFADCQLSVAQISSGFDGNSGMMQFSGFIAFHSFNNTVVRIDLFKNGIKHGSLMPNNEQVGPATKYAKLYISDQKNVNAKSTTTSFDPFKRGYCDICYTFCDMPHNKSVLYVYDYWNPAMGSNGKTLLESV